MTDAALASTGAFPTGSLQWLSRTGANSYDLYCKPDVPHPTADPVQILTHPFLFAQTGVLGREITYTAHYAWGAALPYFTAGSTAWFPSYSFDDGATWTRLNSVTPIVNGSTLALQFTVPEATGDTVLISSDGTPYTWGQYQADLALYRTNSLIGIHPIGTSVQGRPINRFTVGSGAIKIGIYRSGHDNEYWAAWIVRSALLWAAGSSAAAAAFRSACTLHVMQIPSPDTLYNGYMRTTYYQSDGFGRHLNRWNPLGAPDESVEGVEQFAVHTDVEALDLDLFADFHVAPNSAPNMFYAPGDAALAGLDLATWDPSNLIGSVSADTSQGADATLNQYSHRTVAARTGALSLIFDGGEAVVSNGAAMTLVTAGQIGVLLPQMFQAFLD